MPEKKRSSFLVDIDRNTVYSYLSCFVVKDLRPAICPTPICLLEKEAFLMSQFRKCRRSRRDFLSTSCLAGASLGLGSYLGLEGVASQARSASAQSCILIFLNGGMSHLDTFDPKPDQPAEIRGEFKPISTSAADLRVTEPWPLVARQAHH